jgi:hypothetical protein
MTTTANDGNRHVNMNNSSLAHWARKSGYQRVLHFPKVNRHCSNAAGFANANNRQENTQQLRQTRNNKSPTLMARIRVLRNPRHLFFLSSFLVSVGALIAFLLVTDKSQLAELAIGMIQR